MRLLFVGDTHGAVDLDKLRQILPQAQLTPRDALIHCGDFGAPWAAEDDEALRWWRALPYKKIICLGNHENYGWIMRQPIVRRFHCRGWDLGGGLFAPLAGQVTRVGGRRLWFYPGGYSIDYMLRQPGRDVFAQELLPLDEAQRAVDRLLNGPAVDYVLTHDGPRAFILEQFGFPIGPPRPGYWTHLGLAPGSHAHPALLLDQLYHRPDKYTRWYFGHHHRDAAQGKLRCLWQQAVLEDTRTGSVEVLMPPA